MADIVLSRENYKLTGETTDQFNGWEPNLSSGAITGTALTANTDYTIPADFKDHKTVFVATAASDAVLTVKAGNTYQGQNDVALNIKASTPNLFWLDSAKFVDETTGKITLRADKAVTIFGYEMR